MKHRHIIITLILGVFLVMPLTAVSDQVVNRVVAVVGDDVITAEEVERLIRTLQDSLGMSSRAGKNTPTKEQLWRVALERLIEDKIFDREVKRLGLQISDKQLDSYIERIKERNNLSDQEFAAQLSRSGIVPEDYRHNLRQDMLKHQLIKREVRSQVVISDEQVEQYYRDHSDQYQGLDQVRLRALFLRVPESATPAAKAALRKKAEDLLAQAKAQNNMAELATEFSQGPGADKGGELGSLAVSDLLPAMRQALSELKPGQFSPVLEMQGNFVFMQLLERTGQSQIPFAQVRDQIREKLTKEATEAKFKAWMKELRSRTYVKIIE